MTELLTDLRTSFRSLRRQPRFALGVLLTLALGIGANTAIFSAVNAALIKPLPYRDPEHLALIWSRWSNFEKTWVSDREYFGYLEQHRLFEDIGVWDTGSELSLTGGQEPEMIQGAQVTRNLLGVLGISPLLGRGFTADEDVPNGPRVGLIGYDLWRRRFGADPGIVGRAIQVDGVATTVVGVLPAEARLPLEFQVGNRVQLLTPMGLDPASTSSNHSYFAIARLHPGVSATEVTRELRALTTRWTGEGRYPQAMQFSAFAVPVTEEVGGGARVALLTLLGAVALLLLLTCVNVANLLLTRADRLSREMAVRAALGAGRGRLVRMTLTESVVLALGGGLLGLGLAYAALRVIVAAAPTSIPRAADIGLDGTVLGFTLLLSLLTGLVFGAGPALRLSRTSLAVSLKEGAKGSEGPGRRGGRDLLVAAEMGLAIMLVIGAALLVRSFRNLASTDPGFDAGKALTVKLSLPASKYPATADVVRFYEELRHDVAALPGVTAAGLVRVLPLAEDIGDAGMMIEGKAPPDGNGGWSADWQVVSPGLFEALGMRLVKGRFFDDRDTPDGLQVIAVNQAVVDQYFAPGEDPIGRRIRIGGPDRPWRTIVAVLGDTRHHGLTGPIKRTWFVPHAQFANSWGSARRTMTLVLRTGADPMRQLAPVTRAIAARDPDLPLARVMTMDEVLAGAVQGQRFTMTLMAGFALLALFLSALGVYAVIAYSVSQRTREIGIRLALGADGALVRRMIVGQGLRPALIGVTLGLVAAAALSRFLAALLYGVTPLDPATYLSVPVLLLVVAVLSSAAPALRATRVDPALALREE
ncbi:MAG: ABC transporter permease [Gemmatimonadales bacterium]